MVNKIMKKVVFVLFIILLMASVLSVIAQENGDFDNRITINQIDDSLFPQLTLFVNVLDEFGVPVSGLTAADFSVSVDDEPVSILSVENVRDDNLPISVVLVIDTSSSMFGTPLTDAKSAALAFVDNILEGDEIAVIGFNQTASVVQEFTTDLDTVRASINGLTAQGQTALFDATLAASELAARANNPRRFIIFLTDGNEFGSLSSAGPMDSVELANVNNVSFYTIALGYGVQPDYLRQVAENTRGQAFVYPSSAALTELYIFLAEYLRTQYIITVDTDIEPDGQPTTLQINIEELAETASYTPPDLYPQLTMPTVPDEAIRQPVELTFNVDAVRGLSAVTISIEGEEQYVDSFDEGVTSISPTILLDPYALDGGETSTIILSAEDQEGGIRSASMSVDIASLPPQVELLGLDDNISTNGLLTLSVDVVASQRDLESVTYILGDEILATVVDSPFEYQLDTFALPLGDYSLSVDVNDGVELSNITTIFTVAPIASNSEWTLRTEQFDDAIMALVPAGCFQMGSDADDDELPVTNVCVETAFWIDIHPVTNEQYGSSGFFQDSQNPRDRVTWGDAREYCESRGGRLPTEAEWEYAARGPDSLIYPWSNLPNLDLAANLSNSEGMTLPVGSFPDGASWVGALDMAGNVWEWTSSIYAAYPYNPMDGREDPEDSEALRVLRGGAATNTIDLLYSSNRFAALPDSDFALVGFRCVMDYNQTQ
ncbi:MAG: VWA domain-containing protein [Chloroflexi bacterium]|nr:MAG: VWA domain-containing protein [Chloroflexota bacterium]